MSYLNDIEDFTTDQLRKEIHRREQAAIRGECWYCQKNLNAHTCKYAQPSPVPGWVIDPPRFVQGEDCMGREEEYWQTNGKHTVMGDCIIGNGETAQESTERCIEVARDRQREWGETLTKALGD